MSGKVIKTLTNIRYRRSIVTSCQDKIETISEEFDIEFEERAAIIEYMGNIPRAEAEDLARSYLCQATNGELFEVFQVADCETATESNYMNNKDI